MREPIRLLAVIAILLGGMFGMKTLNLVNGAADFFSAEAEAATLAAAAPEEEAHADETAAQDAGDGHAHVEDAAEVASEPEQCDASRIDFAALLATQGITREQQMVLNSLRDRSQQLDVREAELDTRDVMLEAMEQRVDDRIEALRELEGQIQELVGMLSEQEERDMEQIVAWYQGMDPKDSALRIVALDMNEQIAIATLMTPRAFGPILAEMEPADAAAITMTMAARSDLPATAAELEARVGDSG